MPVAIEQAITGVGLQIAFQPIVQLHDAVCVGYEALARWPGAAISSPARVFEQAQQAGVLDDLDAYCAESAAGVAVGGQSTPGMLLAINAEPAAIHRSGAADGALSKAASRFTVVFELTERGLLTHPQAMLRKVAQLRDDGFAIALDDVGAHPDSLALLDIVSPDIIKLDLQLVQSQPDSVQARTIAAVFAHHERTGAVILAEGIETQDHLEQALAYGAVLGQGYRFGAPGDLDGATARWSLPQRELPFDVCPDAQSIFDVAALGLPVRTVRKKTLLALSRQVERLAAAADSPPIVFTTLQHIRYFAGYTRRVYRDLAKSSPLVAIFGEDVAEDVDDGIRGVGLGRDDPLCHEWAIVVLGPDCAAALVARELSVEGRLSAGDDDRRFEMALTFERSRVATAARQLLLRML